MHRHRHVAGSTPCWVDSRHAQAYMYIHMLLTTYLPKDLPLWRSVFSPTPLSRRSDTKVTHGKGLWLQGLIAVPSEKTGSKSLGRGGAPEGGRLALSRGNGCRRNGRGSRRRALSCASLCGEGKIKRVLEYGVPAPVSYRNLREQTGENGFP